MEEPNVTISRYYKEDGSVPAPPNPAWCLVVNGNPYCDYLLGQERDLLEGYFSYGK